MKKRRGRPRTKDKVAAELEAMIIRLKSPENKRQHKYILKPLTLWQRIKLWLDKFIFSASH